MIKKVLVFACSIFIGIGTFSQTDIDSEVLKKHVYFLASDSLEGRGLSTRSSLLASEYIADYFEKSGLKKVGDSYFHPFYARIGQTMLEGRNVVGLVEGSDPDLKNEYLILGAHYDHVSYKFKEGEKVVYNGADDNASGTAGIMEIGRVLAENRDKLKRSVILVAFDAEESGLIGSSRFVKENTVPIDQVKVMFSIDMIGRYAESGSVIMGAMESIKGGAGILMPYADKYDIKIKKTGGETSMRTDTRPFGDVGVPAVYVTSGIVGPYHKPEDDRETLDYDGMEQITKMLRDLTIDLANQESIEPVSKVTAEGTQKGQLPFFRFGVKAKIGGSSNIYPNEFYKAKTGFSSEVGFLTQFRITKNLSLQPEFLYSTMGSKHEDGKFRLHSVTTPVKLIIGSKMEPSIRQRFFASVGGFYSYHFAGSLNKEALDFGNVYDQSGMGINYGIGLEFMSGFIELEFKNGLTNILLQENLGKVRNRGVYFTFGYLF